MLPLKPNDLDSPANLSNKNLKQDNKYELIETQNYFKV